MNQQKTEMFQNRLTKTFRHLSKQAKRQGIVCYRVYDHDLPEFPFCIEIYEDKICLAEYKRHHHMSEEEHELWLESCLQRMADILEIPVENIYLRQRKRKAGRLGQYSKLSSEGEVGEFFTVRESDLKFKVNFTDYLDTGLFLDHRITRSLVRGESKEKRVLNLFCYTGSFSIYAAAGGADSVDSVDLSKTYLKWAEENMELNGFLNPAKHRFIHADVKEWLHELRPETFDLVIMDPPTFSNSKRMKDFLDIQADHVQLINKTLEGMKKGAVLYFSCNYRKFLLDYSRINSPLIKDITKKTTPFDFEGKLSRWCFRIVKPI
jgi:23S rRNA (cytosine1962-C5)-methyltransferase